MTRRGDMHMMKIVRFSNGKDNQIRSQQFTASELQIIPGRRSKSKYTTYKLYIWALCLAHQENV